MIIPSAGETKVLPIPGGEAAGGRLELRVGGEVASIGAQPLSATAKATTTANTVSGVAKGDFDSFSPAALLLDTAVPFLRCCLSTENVDDDFQDTPRVC